MKNDVQTEIGILKQTAELYIEANRKAEKRLGKAPGAQVLMALVLEKEDAGELANDYCNLVLGLSQM